MSEGNCSVENHVDVIGTLGMGAVFEAMQVWMRGCTLGVLIHFLFSRSTFRLPNLAYILILDRYFFCLNTNVFQ